MTRSWNGYLVRALRELASLTAECRATDATIRFRSEQSINGVKIKRLAYGGGGKNNPQRLVPYNDGFVLYIAAQCNFVYLHVLRESAILVSLRFDCPTLGASIVYAVNKLAQAKRTGNREYGALAERYVREFDTKWLRSGASSDEPLVGSADIQSLSDMANTFEVVRTCKSHRLRRTPSFAC